ncbi:MAG TPA: sigma-70 family RNA polymerase sigma factor [Polyangia bacterium]|nr:sigma-70 family RNA polymerase sigma factor [Polyangia bacterium]
MAASEVKRLVEQHLSLVQAIARKVKKSVGASVDVDDLVGYGSKGLVEAAERFEPRHGVAFSTFAYYRIRGAMYDGMRSMGWYSRADYARYRAEERANEYLRSRADRDGAARAEGASPGGEPASALAEVHEILSGVATIHITSLEAAVSVADESRPAADVALEGQRMATRVRRAVGALPDKERRLMELYYFSDKTLEEAGAELGLSKSWACRLHARAVELLRAAIEEVAEIDSPK